jgi:hypothetical protein
MSRLRRGAAWSILTLMFLGIAAGAGSAFASGGCCAMAAEESSGHEAPCHSVAPTSCCEANAAAQAPGLPGAPLAAGAVAPPALAGASLATALFAPPPCAPARGASVVLRL